MVGLSVGWLGGKVVFWLGCFLVGWSIGWLNLVVSWSVGWLISEFVIGQLVG